MAVVEATTCDRHSRASGPRNGTRRGLTLALVSSHAASTRPPQAPEQRMRRSPASLDYRKAPRLFDARLGAQRTVQSEREISSRSGP